MASPSRDVSDRQIERSCLRVPCFGTVRIQHRHRSGIGCPPLHEVAGDVKPTRPRVCGARRPRRTAHGRPRAGRPHRAPTAGARRGAIVGEHPGEADRATGPGLAARSHQVAEAASETSVDAACRRLYRGFLAGTPRGGLRPTTVCPSGGRRELREEAPIPGVARHRPHPGDGPGPRGHAGRGPDGVAAGRLGRHGRAARRGAARHELCRLGCTLVAVAPQRPAHRDPEAGDCQAGQGGEVFYIPHVPPGVSASTDCTVGADQWILAQAGGTIWDNSDGSESTPEDLLALVEADIPVFSEPAVSIDGEDVADIESYWVVNPDFTIEYAEGNVYGLPAGSWDAAMGGWFVIIPPLEPGSHTIVVHDAIDLYRRRGGAAARRADGQRDRRARRVDLENPGRTAPGRRLSAPGLPNRWKDGLRSPARRVVPVPGRVPEPRCVPPEPIAGWREPLAQHVPGCGQGPARHRSAAPQPDHAAVVAHPDAVAVAQGGRQHEA